MKKYQVELEWEECAVIVNTETVAFGLIYLLDWFTVSTTVSDTNSGNGIEAHASVNTLIVAEAAHPPHRGV